MAPTAFSIKISFDLYSMYLTESVWVNQLRVSRERTLRTMESSEGRR
jgi:hypothetical protein